MRISMNRPLTQAVRGVIAGAGLAAMSLGVVGCSEPAAPREEATRTSAAADHHDHDADHDHDHCDHEHGAGPHGGTLADWGGGTYHVEFAVDHDAKEAVVHVLGKDEKTPAPVQAADGKLLLTIREPSFQVDLVARPLAGEVAGAASCYAGMHESLGTVREFTGTISGVVDGTPYAGDFDEHAHDHE